jgi:3-phytase
MRIPASALAVAAAASAATLLTAPPRSDAAPDAYRVTVFDVRSLVETTPVAHGGDAADDPAIWVNASAPAQSLIIGNDKHGALETYDLDGDRVQRITGGGGFGNVDVRGDYVAVSHGGIVIYEVTPATRRLALATDGAGDISTSGEGLCLYDPGGSGLGGGLYAFTVGRSTGRVREYRLGDDDGDGLMSGSLVRHFTVGSESEGCVADDATGSLFISEEDVAVWRYGADPGDGIARTKVAAVGSALPADAEGLTIAGDFLFVSAQNVAHPQQNFIDVFERRAPYSYVKSVRVVAGRSSDDCDRTDGLAAYAGSLGPVFPRGILVCQDGSNGLPGSYGDQDFKLVPLAAVIQAS